MRREVGTYTAATVFNRWGRNLETPGESAYLSGEYATGFIRGLQNNEADPAHWAASLNNRTPYGSLLQRNIVA